jgi:hypothetical protein
MQTNFSHKKNHENFIYFEWHPPDITVQFFTWLHMSHGLTKERKDNLHAKSHKEHKECNFWSNTRQLHLHGTIILEVSASVFLSET